MASRKQLSGSRKRKLKEKKTNDMKRMTGSLEKYTNIFKLNSDRNDDDENERDTQAEKIFTENDPGVSKTEKSTDEIDSSILTQDKSDVQKDKFFNENVPGVSCIEGEKDKNELSVAIQYEKDVNTEEIFTENVTDISCVESQRGNDPSESVLTQHEDEGEKTKIQKLREDEDIVSLSEITIVKQGAENEPCVSVQPEKEETDFQKFIEDIALLDKVNDKIREYFINNVPQQNIGFVSYTERVIGDKKRMLSENHFYRFKRNGEKVKRDWLTLSPSTLKLYCWTCKLFSKNLSTLSDTGFSDWKHATERLREHENSYSHREAVCLMIQRRETSSRIDHKLVEKMNCESKYWYEVLRRVVAVIKFLSTRGLAFFGRNETIGSLSNGNFLGCMELISEFDPFLASHLKNSGNPGSGHTSYLSSGIVSEFVDLMAKKVFNSIISEIKKAKFYAIIVDSTPDLSTTDQLTFVVRYISPKDMEPVERFLTFIQIKRHLSEYLKETVINYIENAGLNISDCRGQSYDNASNMAGKYTGLQTRLKLLNPLAEFIPCSAHSLNLVVVKTVECNGTVLGFFTFIQELYKFFSSSTHRWGLLNLKVKEKGKGDFYTLKSRAVTRWCANAAATKAVRHDYKEILEVLKEMSIDADESPSTRNEASSLHKEMLKFETALCVIIWDTILQRIDGINKMLQNPTLDLSQVPTFSMSLINFTILMRDQFDIYEEKASLLVGHKNYTLKRQRKTPKYFDDGPCPDTVFDSRKNFIIKCFYPVCDTLTAKLKFRMSAYDAILHKFSCLFKCEKDEIHKKAKILQQSYSSDLEDSFCDELLHINSVIEKESSLTEKLKKIHNLGIMDTFANVETALKLFLTLPISNCSGERSFSLLKRIKCPLRTLISDNKLSSLALLSIESDLTVQLDYEDIIKEFTEKKQRRKFIKNH